MSLLFVSQDDAPGVPLLIAMSFGYTCLQSQQELRNLLCLVYFYTCAIQCACVQSVMATAHVTKFSGGERFKGFGLNSNNSVTVSARSVLECTAECGIWPPCRSMQFCVHTNTCVVNSEDVCQAGFSSLHQMPGCTYYDFLDHSNSQALCSPNPCINGGTCGVSCGQHRICLCRSFYFGELCENAHGNWGAWSGWSQCSAECTRTKQRACNSPAPRGSGLHCVGDQEVVLTCGTESGETDGCGEED